MPTVVCWCTVRIGDTKYEVQHGEVPEAVKVYNGKPASPLSDEVWAWVDECHRHRPCGPPNPDPKGNVIFV